MTPTRTATPAAGRVNDVYTRLMSALTTSEDTVYQSKTEDVREMRFILHKFISSVKNLAECGSHDMREYVKAASGAIASHASSPRPESGGSGIAKTLCEILDKFPWSLIPGVALEHQEVNVSLKEIRDGVTAAIGTFSASLQEDGTGDEEYDIGQASSTTPKRIPKSQSKASAGSTPSRTPKGLGHHGQAAARKWSNEESLEILKVVREMPAGNNSVEDIAAEFKRRDTASCAQRGLPALRGDEERTKEAIR